MTRRDTIIIAALVNAGLLVVLFVSALKNEEGREELSVKTETPALVTAEIPFRSEAKRVMGDEVDEVLKHYAQKDPLQPVTPPSPSAFLVDDLKVLTETPPPKIEVEPIPPQALSSEPTYAEVKVKKGDALEKIARQNHTTVSEIMKLNNLSSTQLKIGQVLKVPGKSAVKEEEKKIAAKPPLDPSSAKYYTVKPGDNPWTIAVKNHMKVEELLKLNNMTEEKSRKLKPGDQIRIR
jgi:peptidoglycan endopeptidase LytF